MARTQGSGNPCWNREEVILALELYHDTDGQIPPESDKRVQALSALLRRLPYHDGVAKRASFRNPAGVVFKMQNLHRVATGNGLAHLSATDQRVWRELGKDRTGTKILATKIKQAVEA
ncbi:MAG TPA: hypothetical protein VGH16_08685 [Candidatus Binatia bacterium]